MSKKTRATDSIFDQLVEEVSKRLLSDDAFIRAIKHRVTVERLPSKDELDDALLSNWYFMKGLSGRLANALARYAVYPAEFVEIDINLINQEGGRHIRGIGMTSKAELEEFQQMLRQQYQFDSTGE